MATGQDEDHRKPKNLPDQVVRMLDEEAINPSDRLRLIALYLLYKNGILGADITKLLLHAGLPPQEANVLQNLEFFGARVSKPLTKSASAAAPPPLFPRSHPPPTAPNTEEISISRFVPQLRSLLDAHVAGTLDPASFPYANPADAPVQPDPGAGASAASLRSAKPTWARGRLAAVEPRQRIVVFVAGGATWAEARAAYEVAAATSRDVVLATSHMLTRRGCGCSSWATWPSTGARCGCRRTGRRGRRRGTCSRRRRRRRRARGSRGGRGRRSRRRIGWRR